LAYYCPNVAGCLSALAPFFGILLPQRGQLLIGTGALLWHIATYCWGRASPANSLM